MNKLFFILISLALLQACKSPEARKPVQQNSGEYIDASIARNKNRIEVEEKKIETVMASNPEISYIASENGFWYFYNKKDSIGSATAKFGDRVQFSYSLSDLEGNLISTAKENGLQDYYIDQTNQELITGIRQGLKLMRAGEQVTFLFPSHKAFGYYGLQDKIGTNVPIISIVTLKSIDKI